MYGRSVPYPEKRRRLDNNSEQRDSWRDDVSGRVPSLSPSAPVVGSSPHLPESPVFHERSLPSLPTRLDPLRTRDLPSGTRGSYNFAGDITTRSAAPNGQDIGMGGTMGFQDAAVPSSATAMESSLAQSATFPFLQPTNTGAASMQPYFAPQTTALPVHHDTASRQAPNVQENAEARMYSMQLPPMNLTTATEMDSHALPLPPPGQLGMFPAMGLSGGNSGTAVDTMLLGFGVLPAAIGTAPATSPATELSIGRSHAGFTGGNLPRSPWGSPSGGPALRSSRPVPTQKGVFPVAQAGTTRRETSRMPSVASLTNTRPENEVTSSRTRQHPMQQLQSHIDDLRGGVQYQQTEPSSSRGAALRPVSNLRLGQIPSVVEALNRIPDASPVLRALNDLIKSNQASSAESPVSPRLEHAGTYRTSLFSFSGFPATVYPDPAILTALSRSDLDLAARVFHVKMNRSGAAKAETARRIILYLKKPISWLPPRDDSTTSPSSTAPRTRGRRTLVRDATSALTRPTSRSNGSTVASTGSTVGRTAYTSTSRQLREVNAYDFSSARRGIGGTSSSTAGRRGVQLVDKLSAYNFMDPETPFNVPLGPPLGIATRFVYFDAGQLSQGYEPTLVFASPAPRTVPNGAELQVHLRCLKVEVNKSFSQWTQNWPFPASAKINGNNIELNQAQRYTSGKLAGVDMPTNITAFLRKFKPSSQLHNKAVLRRHEGPATPSPGHFVLFVQEVSVVSNELLRKEVIEESEKYWVEHFKRQRAKTSGRELTRALQSALDGDDVADTSEASKGGPTERSNFDLAKEGVVQFMNSGEGLTSCSMRVSLRCPLALTRIQVPVKGKKCQHIQCFDLENYLSFTRRTPKFSCPVCNATGALPKELVVSPYIEEALRVFTCDEVDIAADGTMSAVEHERTGVRSDDDEDEREPPSGGANPATAGGSSGAVASAGNRENQSGVVDLTLTDDDDDATAQPSPELRGFEPTGDHNQQVDGVPGNSIGEGESSLGSESRDQHEQRQGLTQVPDCRKLFQEQSSTAPRLGNSALESILSDPLAERQSKAPASVQDLLGELVDPNINERVSSDVIALDSD